MNTLQHLRKLGQSLWLDSISREMLDDGRLARYVREFDITGLTSNPTIFDEAIASGAYDADIARKSGEGKSGEELFTELALEDLRRAAELFRPAFERSAGVDGWVSMELSPLIAGDAVASVSAYVGATTNSTPTRTIAATATPRSVRCRSASTSGSAVTPRRRRYAVTPTNAAPMFSVPSSSVVVKNDTGVAQVFQAGTVGSM